MVDSKILSIAAKNGWSVSVSMKNEVRCYDFQRKTLSGVPFCFIVKVRDDNMSNLVNEIASFVDAITPTVCAKEWMIKSGAMDSSRYEQAVADMEDIRTKAWLLACDYSDAAGVKSFWMGLNKNLPN